MVRSYTVYETKIDDPVQQSGKANRIRLAKKEVRQAYFNPDGQLNRMIWLDSTGRLIERELECRFDQKGNKEIEKLKYFHSNYNDSTSLIQTIETHLKFGYHSEVLVKNRYFKSIDKSVHTDSIAYNYDAERNLITEVSTQINAKGLPQLVKKYSRKGSQLVVESFVDEVEVNREEYLLDDKNRILEAKYFSAQEVTPRMQVNYQYHPRGWLEELNYIHNWDFFKKEETVISCKNRYDDHGKLFEVQKDYGNGKRLFEFYDYSYFVNEQ